MSEPGPQRQLSAEDLATLNDEIAGMARAGLPLDQGLSALAKEMGKGRLQRVTADIARDLAAGLTLPQAMERQGSRVPPYYAALVLAGVRTGRLHEVLATLTLYARSLADLRSIIVEAILYPAVVMALALTLFGFVFFYIIPQFELIFEDFKMRLPVATEVVFYIARHPLELVLGPILVVIVGLMAVRIILAWSAGGRRTWMRFVYSLPIVGTLIRSARLAAFADLLGILVDRETPLPEALLLASQASSDPLLHDAAEKVRQDLSQGQSFGQTSRAHAMVPELVSWMIALGEERGTLGPSLHQVAQVFRRRAEMRANLLRSVLAPFLLILMAILLGTIFAVAVGLPMGKFLEGLSGTGKH